MNSEVIEKAVGKFISSISLVDDQLIFTMDDGYRFRVADTGQSCCEHRYMVIDDDLTQFFGDVLVGFETKAAPDIEDGEDCHEVTFLEVKTSKSFFTVASHNEHNGYYGGFDIEFLEG